MNESSTENIEEVKKKMIKDMIEQKSKKKEKQNHPDSPVTLNDKNFSDIIEKYPLVVVDFWASWCGPCKMMEPVIENMAKKYSGKVVFGKMNVDKNKRIPSRYQISSIPTLMIFKNGKIVDKIVGATRENQLSKKLEKYIE